MHRSASFTRSYLIAIVIAVAGVSSAEASFLSTSPDPFPPGSGFVQSPGCLTNGSLSGLCASGVTGAILSSSSIFAGGNQEFVLDERVPGEISFEGAPIGDFSVDGDLDLTLFGRTTLYQTGTFEGVPVEFTLDPTMTSTVQVTINSLPNTTKHAYPVNAYTH